MVVVAVFLRQDETTESAVAYVEQTLKRLGCTDAVVKTYVGRADQDGGEYAYVYKRI